MRECMKETHRLIHGEVWVMLQHLFDGVLHLDQRLKTIMDGLNLTEITRQQFSIDPQLLCLICQKGRSCTAGMETAGHHVSIADQGIYRLRTKHGQYSPTQSMHRTPAAQTGDPETPIVIASGQAGTGVFATLTRHPGLLTTMQPLFKT